ncbi:MAG: phage Gp37/Gp68 family protein [Zoogloeaceae bacterium]|jgi:protein gp37|nr:phage Gp37/Gp68 family protein [Zoogloeaceae bacterium]
MGANTKIAWAHHTFNPWYGCQKVSHGCDHCYAESWGRRFGVTNWGKSCTRKRSSSANWKTPLAWNDEAARKGIRYRVFCASLGDVFDNAVPESWRTDLFVLIRKTPNLDWLLLTKRIGNADRMIAEAVGALPPDEKCGTGQWPWENVWLGITVCNQDEADRDIPKLLNLHAKVRWLSMEPLLGDISFVGMFANPDCIYDGTNALQKIDWLIVGGESGAQARPMHPDWVRSLRDQCAAVDTPFLFKQWGTAKNQRGGYGRELDGRLHDGYPQEAA